VDVEDRLRNLEKQLEMLRHNSYSLFAGQQLDTWGLAVRSISASEDLCATDMFVPVDASAGPVTVTLPPVLGACNQVFFIKKTDASANAVTVACREEETIDGAETYTLSARYETVAVVSDGSAWHVLSTSGAPTGFALHAFAYRYAPSATNDLTTSTTYVDTSCSVTIAITVRCTLLVYAVWKQGVNQGGAANSFVQLLEGANVLFTRKTDVGDGPVGCEPWVGALTQRPAGTYTFKFQHRISNSAYSSRFHHGSILVLAIPD